MNGAAVRQAAIVQLQVNGEAQVVQVLVADWPAIRVEQAESAGWTALYRKGTEQTRFIRTKAFAMLGTG
ncbi:hypothetical protein D3C84_1186500 [compost metagenome]